MVLAAEYRFPAPDHSDEARERAIETAKAKYGRPHKHAEAEFDPIEEMFIVRVFKEE